MHDVLICGTCVADVLVKPVSLNAAIGGGRLFSVDPIAVTTGGIVCNSGIALRRLGMRVAAASLVGDDAWGVMVRDRLAAEDIDVAGLETHPTLATATTAVLIDAGGERSFAHHVGAPAAIDLEFIRRQAARPGTCRMAVLGYHGLLPGLEGDLAAAVREIASTGCQVAVETGGDGGPLESLAAALPDVAVYVPSLDEAARQTGRVDPRAIVARYRACGAAGLLGVKLGSRGTLLSPADGVFVDIPCVPAPRPVADTTGAGDAFLAGLLTGLLRGMDARRAGLLGAATAAWCVTGVGGTAGLRSFADTQALVAG